MPEILIIIIIGGIAGWLAGMIVDGEIQSLLLDIVIGIIGGYIGHRMLGSMLYLTPNHYVNLTLTATAGAVVLALIIKLLRRAINR